MARGAALLSFLLVCHGGVGAEPAAVLPDLIVHNGKIVTVDAGFSVAQAMAVKDGKIVAVGRDTEVLAAKGTGTAVVD